MDLKQHLLHQILFSERTFGPGTRTVGVSEHIRKELDEVAEEKSALGAASEWVDVVILAMDGLSRALRAAGWAPGEAAEMACRMIQIKQSRNEQRDWPDWRTADPDKAIEHFRGTHD